MPTTKKPTKRIVKQGNETVIVLPPVKVPKWLEGFVSFIREQGVVGLTVAFVFGVAAKSLIDSFVTNMVNPIAGLIGGGNSGDLSSRFVCIRTINTTCTTKLGYGAVLSQLLSFIIVAFVIYFMVKGLKLDKLDKKKQ